MLFVILQMHVNLIWYLYPCMLNKICLSLTLSLRLHPFTWYITYVLLPQVTPSSCINIYPELNFHNNISSMQQLTDSHSLSGAPFTDIIWLIPTQINNHIIIHVWKEITYPFPNFNCPAVEVWKWISNVISHFAGHMITYPCWDKS